MDYNYVCCTDIRIIATLIQSLVEQWDLIPMCEYLIIYDIAIIAISISTTWNEMYKTKHYFSRKIVLSLNDCTLSVASINMSYEAIISGIQSNAYIIVHITMRN